MLLRAIVSIALFIAEFAAYSESSTTRFTLSRMFGLLRIYDVFKASVSFQSACTCSSGVGIVTDTLSPVAWLAVKVVTVPPYVMVSVPF